MCDAGIWSIRINANNNIPLMSQLPASGGLRDSHGNVYVKVHDLGFGNFSIIFADHNHVFVCTLSGISISWNNLNANNAFDWDTDPHERWRVHEDPHAIAFSSDFEIDWLRSINHFHLIKTAKVSFAMANYGWLMMAAFIEAMMEVKHGRSEMLLQT